MQRRLYRAQNSPILVSGYDLIVVISTAIGGLVALVKFGLLWGIVGGIPGLLLGRILSKCWYEGRVIRKLYWYLPIAKLLGKKKLPDSCFRRFM